ncbi:MFS transporter [Nocardia sp. NPDC051990]|uniref:MFS transporter n=1 Tax=Nocardia sp. NPDC051990 TaxID=3155285 RepID=UPI003438DB78
MNAAALGFYVDVIDIYLPTVVLAPAIIFFAPPDSSLATSTTMFYIIFAATLLARPFGAVVFGHIADTVGRRRSVSIAIPCVAALTLAMAALPGYSSIGIVAYVLMLAVRFMGGFFMGGATAGLPALAMESSPKNLRGVVGAYTNIGYPLGAATISVAAAIVLHYLPANGIGSSYVQWGWRMPFVLGAVATLGFLIYFRKVVTESLPAESQEKGTTPRRRPLMELTRGQNRRSLIHIFIMMSGVWLGFHAISSAVPGVLVNYLGQSASTVSQGLVAANIILAFCYFGYGALGQRIGRRKVLMWAGVSVTTLGASLYAVALLNASNGGSGVVTMALIGICIILAAGIFPVSVTYITERFPTSVRATGFAVGYSVATMLPALYSFYMLGLEFLVPYSYTPVILVVIAGCLTTYGAWMGPETRDVDLDSVGTDLGGTASLTINTDDLQAGEVLQR